MFFHFLNEDLFYAIIFKSIYIHSVKQLFLEHYLTNLNKQQGHLFREELEQMEDQTLYQLMVELDGLESFLLPMVDKNY